MRKRNVMTSKSRLSMNNRRRLLLKRLHQKVISRRQQFQQQEMYNDEIAEAC